MKPARNYLIKTLLYFLINKPSTSKMDFPVKEWCRGYVVLTSDTLHLQLPDGNYRLSMPLNVVVKAERLRKGGGLRFIPTNFMAGQLEVDSNHTGGDLYSVILSGPRSVMAPFWDMLIQRLKKAKAQEENKDLRRLLYLLSLGVKSLQGLGFLLNMRQEKVLSGLSKLYKEGLIDSSGDLTEKGLRKLSEAVLFLSRKAETMEDAGFPRMFRLEGRSRL
ncbi:MAG: hypothetical protein DRO46_02150 [Candidatus Hecatellales archaeon]|nr:MAG: hypothetical protein DRO46_02150 [Candidatus Hecatellales archaeon]